MDLFVQAATTDFNVEVKAPYKELTTGVFCGNDSDVIEAVLKQANTQFAENKANVLFLTPNLRFALAQDRYQLIQAFIGEETIEVPIALSDKDGPIKVSDESYLGFKANGQLVRPGKPDGSPAHTRVSAIVSCEEGFAERGQSRVVDHQIPVVHNPFAKHPIPVETFSDFVQFHRVRGGMKWSDNHRIGP